MGPGLFSIFGFDEKCPKFFEKSYLGSRYGVGDGRSFVLCEELANTFRELCALAGPVVNALALKVYAGGVGAGVVGADNFDRAAVAGAVLFNYNDAIVGLLSCSNARQTNHQHWGCFLSNLNVFRGSRDLA